MHVGQPPRCRRDDEEKGAQLQSLNVPSLFRNHALPFLHAQAAFKAAVAVRNKAGEFPFNAAAKAGHNNVKEKLQPIRHTLESHLARIDSVQQFKKARAFVRDYSVQRLKHELLAPQHLKGSAL